MTNVVIHATSLDLIFRNSEAFFATKYDAKENRKIKNILAIRLTISFQI
jgi:hypothetical protein